MEPTDNEPDRERVQDQSMNRQQRRAEATESVLVDLDRRLEESDLTYPVSSEDLATAYGTEPIDLPNDTETVGDVVDRLADEQYDSPEAVRKAVADELFDSTEPDGETTAPQDR